MKKFDVISFGSVTLDTFISPCPIPGIPLYDKDAFHIPIGEKIKICDAFKSAGGSAINSSAGFKSLGLTSAAVGFIGDDEIGKFILKELKARKISTQFINIAKRTTSSFSVILNTLEGKRTVFHYRDKKEDFTGQHLLRSPEAKAVYIGHLYSESEDMLDSIPKWKKLHPTSLLGWNPGKTQFEKNIQKFKKILPAIDLLILNKEEGEQFTKLKAKELKYKQASEIQIGKKIKLKSEFLPEKIFDVREIAQKFLSLGVKNVIITDGSRGAQFFDKSQHFHCLPKNVKVRSTLGAGDAFAVGSFSAMILHQPKEKYLLWGTSCASSVLQEFGALSNLMTRKKIEK